MRKFGRKSYYTIAWKHRKSDAEKLAKAERTKGALVRIVKSWNPSAPPHGQWGYEVLERWGR